MKNGEKTKFLSDKVQLLGVTSKSNSSFLYVYISLTHFFLPPHRHKVCYGEKIQRCSPILCCLHCHGRIIRLLHSPIFLATRSFGRNRTVAFSVPPPHTYTWEKILFKILPQSPKGVHMGELQQSSKDTS